MIRTGIWILAGLVLGLIIHLVVVLTLPTFASRDLWTRVASMDAMEKTLVLDQPGPGEPNPLGLDPALAYAICRLDLSQGAGAVSGMLPDAFWSLSVFDRAGISLYSTTNRSGIGQVLDLGIFNKAQTRMLAEQQLEIQEGLLIVESPQDDVFVAIRLAPPHRVMLPRYREALSQIACTHLNSDGISSPEDGDSTDIPAEPVEG